MISKHKHAELIKSISSLYNNSLPSSSSLYRCGPKEHFLDECTTEQTTQTEQVEQKLTFEEARELLWTKYSTPKPTNYVNNNKEKFTNMQTFDKYDEIINEDISKADPINGNERYENYILSLRKQYNAIIADIEDSLSKNLPESQNIDELITYLKSYSGKKGLHIVYVYENFNVNLAKNIVKNLHPEFKLSNNLTVKLRKNA